MNLIERISLFVKKTAQEIRAVRERLVALENKPANSIDDSAVREKVDASLSSFKTELPALVRPTIEEEISKVVGGAPETFNTLKEVADYIEADKTGASAMATSINNRLRFDEVQSLSVEQRKNVFDSLGLNDVDLVSIYEHELNS